MLKGYCQNGDLLKVQRSGIRCHAHGCAHQSAVLAEALCMFQEMKEHCLRCDELVYNTLMEGASLARSAGVSRFC